jgi:hypothetical protein
VKYVICGLLESDHVFPVNGLNTGTPGPILVFDALEILVPAYVGHLCEGFGTRMIAMISLSGFRITQLKSSGHEAQFAARFA